MSQPVFTYRVAPLAPADRSDWASLYAGYAHFYGTSLTHDIENRVWHWLLDADHVLEGLLVRRQGQPDSDSAQAANGATSGEAVGLLHVRACPHPLSGTTIGFVDDMYIAPHARGQGASTALVDALKRLAGLRQWPRLRWVTQQDNTRGRALYDRITGGASEFILYNWSDPAGLAAPPGVDAGTRLT